MLSGKLKARFRRVHVCLNCHRDGCRMGGFECATAHGEKRISSRISEGAAHQFHNVGRQRELTTLKLSDTYLL
jgi:hypothetical protein